MLCKLLIIISKNITFLKLVTNFKVTFQCIIYIETSRCILLNSRSNFNSIILATLIFYNYPIFSNFYNFTIFFSIYYKFIRKKIRHNSFNSITNKDRVTISN